MRKITFLLTLLLMYVGVTPMMAAYENLELDESKTYTIKNSAGQYLYLKTSGKYTYVTYGGSVDASDENCHFVFVNTGNKTANNYTIYNIRPKSSDSNYTYYGSFTSGEGVYIRNKKTDWCVLSDEKGNHFISKTNVTDFWKTSGPYSEGNPLQVSSSLLSGHIREFKIEEVGGESGGESGGGESGGNEGGSGETTTNNLPAGVQVSATPTAQKEWVEGSHFFYTIKNAGTGNYLTTDNMSGQDFTFDGSVQNPDKSGYWCIAGNDQDGYGFYNYETGQILATTNKAILGGSSRAFLKGINEDNLSGDEMKFVFTTSNQNSAWSCIKVVNTDNIYWIAHTNFANKLKLVNDGSALSNSAAGFIFEAVDPFAPIDANLTNTLISNAESAMSKTGVGYPTADCPERAPLIATIAAAKENPTSQDLYDDLADAYKKFLKSPYVTMPEDGKAYVFINKNKQSRLRFLYDNNGELSFSQQDYSGACPVEAKFICRKLSVSDNGTSANYAFVNNNGQFLIWKGNEGGNDNNDGFAAEYNSPVTLKKMVGVDEDLSDLFGTMTIGESGKLFARTSTGGFSTKDVTGDLYTSDFSTAFILEEVSYPNIVTLTEVTGTDVLCEDFKGKTIATFSAPFATVLPDNVTAYNVEKADGYAYLGAISGGSAIPANFGVILVGKDRTVTSALIKPRTTETIATLNNFRLSNSAGAPVEIGAGDYILAKKEGQGIGFYESNPGTLAMNKAFLRFGASQTSAFRLVLGEEVTGINGVATEKADAPIYDLSGRRVLNTVKGGIYIQNGKKFIVK